MKKTVIFLLAMLFSLPAHAEEGGFLNTMNKIINNSRDNMKKSIQDMSSYSKETRQEWGKNNEYHDIYGVDTNIPEEPAKKHIRDSKYYEPENTGRSNDSTSSYENTRSSEPTNLVPVTNDYSPEEEARIKEIESDPYYQPTTPTNMSVETVRDLGDVQEAIEVDPYEDNSWR